jgi:hypothetical protein
MSNKRIALFLIFVLILALLSIHFVKRSYGEIEINRFNNPSQMPTCVGIFDDPGDGPLTETPTVFDIPLYCGFYKSVLSPKAYWWYWMNLKPGYGNYFPFSWETY